MGPWHQIAFTLGVTFAFLQTYMLSLVCSPNLYWRVVYTFPIIPLLYQAYNIRNRFPFETPKYLLQTNRELEARELLAKLYKSSFV